MQKLLTKRVTVNRVCAGGVRWPKEQAIYAKSMKRDLSERSCHPVFATGHMIQMRETICVQFPSNCCSIITVAATYAVVV